MDVKSAMVPDDVDAAWRFLLFNWIVVGTMAATLVLSVAVTNFSIGLTGVLVAIGLSAFTPALPMPMPARRSGAIRRSCSSLAPPRRSY